ncbi:NAD(P)H-dependent D-xylose reductase isoform X1 [Eurytemora carolleeae]|uniref:NAD(P)H-dependent D-xylose reductase isoform X1 n=1 Tax=Eurytemora carolleeae TaxID=1294199 RepID=UPI000C75F38C|nr:NAD(P)H-dependent D-xylose reductase isoform X1 [Eurytemora carolleeae]XP_023341920.1 NAD(P)H-dependent D-xylose reductase isoform X1 [Eurytemora carolleeae]|eukprot:XP_023341919.1 NAD(P)H-dependent D-xylose reductase-like isoform X1 [Eurytemora affinis]
MTGFPLPVGSMPTVGYGCWKLGKDKAADIVEKVITMGYRHIDSASDYGNEKEVGLGLKRVIDKGICSRADLFVTSKLWNTYHHPDNVLPACKRTLSDLGLEYLDLYLIHFPISLKFVPFETRYPPEWFHDPDAKDKKMEFEQVPVQDTWRAMEKLVDAGLVKNIGVSNWNCQGLRDLLSFARIKPSVLQIELHPYLQQPRLVNFAQSNGLVVTAFSPMGHGASYFNQNCSTLNEKIIQEIATEKGVQPGQVILRWGVQRGCAVIPKSENDDRIRQNLDVTGFELTDEEMKKIATIDRNMRFNDPGVFCPAAFNTECPIWD